MRSCRIPRGQEKFLAIMDLKGWGYANCDVRAYIAAIEIMQVRTLRACLVLKKFYPKVSHRILRHMHGVLNVDKKKTNCTVR